MAQTSVLPSPGELQRHFDSLYGDVRKHGWQVRMRHRFGYFGGEDWYEATVDRLVRDGCAWIDVGGGKGVLPHNKSLSLALSRRCGLLVGVDPSANIQENPYVHERAQCIIQDYTSERKFDLATLRMVAEHIEDPKSAIDSLARLVKPGGKVVIVTPNRWSPLAVAASLLPHRVHQILTHLLWGTKDEDVFPTVYKMNTRKRLRALFEEGGFKEVDFAYLDSCDAFHRFRVSCFLELSLWRFLRKLGITYPENNLLGIYERV